MEIVKLEKLNFSYPERNTNALTDINISIGQGEFVLICGKSGCGKTTLLRLLKPSLAPHGNQLGTILFKGDPLREINYRQLTSEIGFVMQSPDNQIVTDKVWHELAFGLESLGYNNAEIRARVSEMASFFGIQTWFHKNTSELSGGQKQLLNLASVMVMQPEVLILDEPTSQLDPIAASEFLNTLKRINRELGTTVILSEHRLEDTFSIADRVIVMDEGQIIADDSPQKVGKTLKEINHDMLKALPTPMKIFGAIKNPLPCPVTIREGRMWLEKISEIKKPNFDAIPQDDHFQNENGYIKVKNAYFRYKKELPDTIKGLDLQINKGEFYCLLGGNATGKTTALSLLSGLYTPYRGEITIDGQNISKIKNPYDALIGFLPQNPQTLFIKNTVKLDLLDVLSEKDFSMDEKEQKIRQVCSLCRITEYMNTHPYDLSGGEQQRVALAKILLLNPKILLLDEPTKGMDASFKEEFSEIISDLKNNNVTIIMVSHDIEFCARYADRCGLMFDGSITSSGKPREFFKGKTFYTTAANRMARKLIPDAVLCEDIILALGGVVNKNKKITPKAPEENTVDTNNMKNTKPNNKFNPKDLIAPLIVLLLVPVTIYIGVFLLDSRKYYLISLLIILETLIPFCMVFESGKPRARELVVISVMCALAVSGRAVFFMLPQVKPIIALVIISGVCFGGETGFLVGAVSGFISNFFFGHGPWTPWQMFAFGIIGFFSGLLFKNNLIKAYKFTLSLFGFVATLVIYGGIMNPASIIMMQTRITKEMLISSYAVGLPLDLIHSFSTFLFLWFLAEPMIRKINRIKIKYGLIS